MHLVVLILFLCTYLSLLIVWGSSASSQQAKCEWVIVALCSACLTAFIFGDLKEQTFILTDDATMVSNRLKLKLNKDHKGQIPLTQKDSGVYLLTRGLMKNKGIFSLHDEFCFNQEAGWKSVLLSRQG